MTTANSSLRTPQEPLLSFSKRKASLQKRKFKTMMHQTKDKLDIIAKFPHKRSQNRYGGTWYNIVFVGYKAKYPSGLANVTF
jgi:hypothetical protein